MASSDAHSVGAPRFVAESDLLRRAYALAADAHRDQAQRGSESPYVEHPVSVATRLHSLGFDEQVLVAALLHDAVEDSEVTLGEVTERFGVRAGELVAALTEDDSIREWGARKRALRRQVADAGHGAAAIYAADKVSNVRDARTLYARMGEAAAERFGVSLDARVGAWREDLEMLLHEIPDFPPLGDLRTELDALERERATVGTLEH